MTLTDPKTSNISVIIPTLNEAARIAETIESAKTGSFEVIVVDSGTDNTASIASRLGCKVITAPAGRASQMNTGARAATGEILLFLHSDTLLPKKFPAEIYKILRQPHIVCGAFKLHINQPGSAIRLIEFCTNIRAKVCSMPYGDQAVFMYKSQFDSINGYEDVLFLEDVLLIKNMKTRGKIGIVDQKVTTSGRRWQKHGIIKTTLTNRLIMLGFLLGVSPKHLQSWYRFGKE